MIFTSYFYFVFLLENVKKFVILTLHNIYLSKYIMSEISVFYNWYNNVQTFTCDWDTSIYLDWNFNFTQSNNLFTPYFNIYYTDWDNQVLTWQYDKSDLYLQWQYNKTYTWWVENYWVFNPLQGSFFTWYNIQFETWEIIQETWEITTWNVFANFWENMLSMVFWNISWYFQYITIFWMILIIIWLVRRLKKWR